MWQFETTLIRPSPTGWCRVYFFYYECKISYSQFIENVSFPLIDSELVVHFVKVRWASTNMFILSLYCVKKQFYEMDKQISNFKYHRILLREENTQEFSFLIPHFSIPDSNAMGFDIFFRSKISGFCVPMVQLLIRIIKSVLNGKTLTVMRPPCIIPATTLTYTASVQVSQMIRLLNYIYRRLNLSFFGTLRTNSCLPTNLSYFSK